MKVIDLVDDGTPPAFGLGRARSVQETRITSRHGRKAANQITNSHPELDWAVITAKVQDFCTVNPDIRDIDQIVARCAADLLSGGKTVVVRERQNGPVGNIEDTDQQGLDEDLRVLSKSTPLVEILNLLPNAKKDYVQKLVDKFNNNIELVIQDMLDNGYEKEEAQSSSSHLNSSAEKTAPSIDFTSSAWDTSAAYRRDAVPELARSFPFVTQPSLTAFFKKEKFHFYHALMALEKVFKLPALQFAPGRVQSVLGSLTSGAEEPSGIDGGGSSSGKGKSPSSSRTAGGVIELLDSQQDSGVEVLTHAPSTPTSLSGLRRKHSVSAAASKFLTKQQVAELRARGAADGRGLAVKAVVMATYRMSLDEQSGEIQRVLDPVLEQEMAFIAQLKARELLQADQAAAERLNEELATAEGSLMECGCCYGEYAFEALVQCSEGHLFCKQCLQRYCEQTVFGE